MNRRIVKAFTLTELLVVIAAISILIALLFPALSIVEEKANRAKCLSNLHQIAVAAVQQFGELGDKLPFRGHGDLDNFNFGLAAEQLMPYVKNVKEVFHCPSNPGWVNTNYLMPNFHFYTEYEINSYLCAYSTNEVTMNKRQSRITDYSIAAYAYDVPYCPSSPHETGINVAYLDGHAAWLDKKDFGLAADCSALSGVKAFFQKGHDF
jgi:prepilin-type N-terminal cleavage/methylation domain-containing protein/prepilin-type processing-associated H-X9-DG protein